MPELTRSVIPTRLPVPVRRTVRPAPFVVLSLSALAIGLVASGATAVLAAATNHAIVRPVVLPRDQGAHPSFGEEWWYTSGTLTGSNRRDYFWLATVWSAAEGLVAKVNVLDLRADRVVLSDEYLTTLPATRGQRQFDLGSFQLVLLPGARRAPWTVTAPTADGGDLKLRLTPRQNYVRHGVSGVIEQGSGGPSAYYSNPRLAAVGSLRLGNTTLAVHGQGWLDHQWGNFGTDLGALRWNWFACQFRGGADLMLYQFLSTDDRPSGQQAGTFVTRAGAVEHLGRFVITPLPPSVHPRNAVATYPLRWRLRIPSAHVNITLRARAHNQFITNRFVPSFWEAASAITAGGAGICTVESSREVSRTL